MISGVFITMEANMTRNKLQSMMHILQRFGTDVTYDDAKVLVEDRKELKTENNNVRTVGMRFLPFTRREFAMWKRKCMFVVMA